jgi:hypothetical membrane protein
MIATFPPLLLLPGLLFIAAGIYYWWRANQHDTSDLGLRMKAATRTTGNTSIILGSVLLALSIPLIVAIYQLK